MKTKNSMQVVELLHAAYEAPKAELVEIKVEKGYVTSSDQLYLGDSLSEDYMVGDFLWE